MPFQAFVFFGDHRHQARDDAMLGGGKIASFDPGLELAAAATYEGIDDCRKSRPAHQTRQPVATQRAAPRHDIGVVGTANSFAGSAKTLDRDQPEYRYLRCGG
jgi:hypothetical protein